MGRGLARTVGVAASIAGRSHEAHGREGQDVAWVRQGAITVAALADGAGSATHARVGAEAVVGAVVSLLGRELDRLVECGPDVARARILSAVDAALDAAAGELGARPRDLASTLLFAAVGPRRTLMGHLGDGVVAARLRGREVLVSSGAAGEHAGETVFVPTRSSNSDLHLFAMRSGEVDAVALMSDGAAEGLVGGTLEHPEARQLSPVVGRWWDGLARYPLEVVDRALHASLEGPIRKTTSDDCAVAVLRRMTLQSPGEALELGWLGHRTTHAAKLRARVARAWSSLGSEVSPVELSRRLHLGVHSVRRQLAALRRAGWEVAPR